MSTTAAALAAPAASAVRPGYDPDAATTAQRVLPMLAEERVVWLSMVRPDGTPHLVPTWFWWDGESLLFWSRPNAAKIRNLRGNPRLMVAVGDAEADFSVGLVEAVAQPVDLRVPDAFFAKYADELAAGRLDRASFEALYTQAVRVVPTRFLAWRGRGEGHDRAAQGRAPLSPPVTGASRVAGLAERLAGLLDRSSARLRAAGKARVEVLAA